MFSAIEITGKASCFGNIILNYSKGYYKSWREFLLPIIALLLMGVLIALDQFIKVMVLNHLKPIGIMEIIPGFFDFVYVENRGAAFGMLENQKWLFVIVTVLVSTAIIYLLFRYKNHTVFSYWASILIVAGGVGNLIDRVLRGFVVDYIHFSFFPPVFNFADCCVTIGTIFLIIHVLFFMESKGKHIKEKNIKEL